ncbi:MFS transporter [Streptomyces sp. ISL-94]|nr:MFS transporter [Streptomyces sp. ISL-94]
MGARAALAFRVTGETAPGSPAPPAGLAVLPELLRHRAGGGQHSAHRLPRSLRDPRIGMGACPLALMSFALFGALFVITLHLQGVLGYTPWQAGIRTLPLPFALSVGAVAALPLAARWGERLPVVAGLVLVTAAFGILTTTTTTDGYGQLVLFQIVAGLGAGATAAAGTEAVMGAVPGERAGVGSAVNDATRQVGSSLGVAVQGSILSSVYGHRMNRPTAGLATPDAGDSILAVRALAPRLPDAQAAHLLATAKESFVSGLTHSAAVAGTVTLVTALAAAHWLPAPRAPPEAPVSTPAGLRRTPDAATATATVRRARRILPKTRTHPSCSSRPPQCSTTTPRYDLVVACS